MILLWLIACGSEPIEPERDTGTDPHLRQSWLLKLTDAEVTVHRDTLRELAKNDTSFAAGTAMSRLALVKDPDLAVLLLERLEHETDPMIAQQVWWNARTACSQEFDCSSKNPDACPADSPAGCRDLHQTLPGCIGAEPCELAIREGWIPFRADRASISLGDVWCAIDRSHYLTCEGARKGGSGPFESRRRNAEQVAVYGRTACVLGGGDRSHCWSADGLPGVAQTPDEPLRAIAAGPLHACGLTLKGERRCWGEQPLIGPATTGPLWGLGLGETLACGTSPKGAVTCWGGAEAPSGIWRGLEVHGGGACAIGTDDSVTCWGVVPVLPEGPAAAIALGARHACVLRPDDTIACFGASSPPPDGAWDALDASDSRTCAVTAEGAVQCWAVLPER